MKQIYKIDENGFLQFGQEVLIDEGEEIPSGYTDVPLPSDLEGHQLPFFRPKLVGGAWVEDMSQEDIDALINAPVSPSAEERIVLLQHAVDFILMNF